ncbi:uncharacterized protein LOC126856533 [Cataglyphis hispanica]|uniref:uncharacterized protein LOC126856533 n=1 Tax=Cataglyphis hispanica TaxID=1086592 RepID=UPI00217F3530|nr:uncharacterized protein LOC126856533 [Cataglyphis hispanica]
MSGVPCKVPRDYSILLNNTCAVVITCVFAIKWHEEIARDEQERRRRRRRSGKASGDGEVTRDHLCVQLRRCASYRHAPRCTYAKLHAANLRKCAFEIRMTSRFE